MKTPNPIDFETDAEYEYQMNLYEEHLRHEEWNRNGAQKALNMWVLVIGTLVGLSFLGAYLIKYGII